MLESVNKSQALVIATILFALICLRIPQLDDSLLGRHSYRQTQTALTAYWFAKEGVQLPDYQTPIFGVSGSGPMEFPTFQLFVAVVHSTGIPLDMASHLCGLIAFILAVLVSFLLMTRLRISSTCMYVFLLFAAFSPFALTWSTSSLIEFTGVTLGLAYLYFCLMLREGKQTSIPYFVLAVIFGCVTAITKSTTLPIFWGPCFLLAVASFWDVWRDSQARKPSALIMQVIGWGLVLALPLVSSALWIYISDMVKDGSFITSSRMSGTWSSSILGSISQRFSVTDWSKVIGRTAIWGLCGLFPLTIWGIYSLRRVSRDGQIIFGGLLVGACGAILIFFKLYVVHDYYQCATMFVFWMVTAIGIGSLLDRIQSASRKLALLILGGAYLLIFSFSTGYFRGGQELDANEILATATEIRELTDPQDEFLLFRIDWNSSMTYYAERKSLIAHERPAPGVWLPDPAYLKEYAEDRQIRYAVTMVEKQAIVPTIWPQAKIASENAKYIIYDISPVE